MVYIFMDESGDLGFDFRKKRTSTYFIITFLFAETKRPIEKIVKQTFQGFSYTQRKHHPGVLHAHKELPLTRMKVLHSLKEKNVNILTIYLNKVKVYTKLQDEKQVLYNFVTNILLDRLYTKKFVSLNDIVHLIASRRETNKFLNDNFKDYLKGQLLRTRKVELDVQIMTPNEEKCLQVVDFVSWAIFRMKEYGDDRYWQVIKGKIIEDRPLFP